MSNYPPTPSFGLPLGFAPSAPSSTARPLAENKNRQAPAKAQRKSSGPVSRTTYAQTANAFQQNQAIPDFGMQAAFGSSPPMSINGQFLNGMIPPPPYPPIPGPLGNLPGYNPPFPAESMPDSSMLHQSALGSTEINQAIKMSSSSHQMVEQDREEGELSDGEIRGKSTPLGYNASIIVPQPTRSGTYTHESVLSPGATRDHKAQRRDSPIKSPQDSRGSSFLNNQPLTRAHVPQSYDRYPLPKDPSHSSVGKRYDQYIPEYKDREIDYPQSSYQPQSSVPSPPHQETSQQTHNTQITKSIPPRHYSPTAGKSHEEIRKLAKHAVLNLIPLKVGYNDYIQEGIDEEVVRGLFEELGQKIPVQNPSPAKQTKQDSSSSAQLLPMAPSENSNNEKVANSSIATKDMHGVPDIVSSGNPLASSSSTPADRKTALEPADEPNTSVPSLGRPLPVSLTSEAQPSTSDNSTSPKLTRAEIIKQRFAERESKSLQQDKAATSSLSAKAVNAPEAASGMKKDKIVEQEKISKNELIKQRMEALKKTAMFKNAEKQSATQNGVNNQANHPQASATFAGPAQSPQTVAPLPENPADGVVPFSGIPGLFMTSSSAPKEETSFHQNPELFLPPQVQGTSRRKRPVAMDFDDAPTPTTNSFKRPFGRSRIDRPLVIDVSDDDSTNADEDSDMDIDGEDQSPESDQSQKAQASKERSSFRDFPPLPDFPSRRRPGMWASAPGSALNTPPLSKDSPFSHPSGRNKNFAQEDLRRKEEQIQLMRKKLAEMQQSKKSKQGSSRVHTPGTPNRSVKTSRSGQAASKSPDKKDAAAAEIDRLIEDAQRQVISDQLKVAEAKAAELEKIKKAEFHAKAAELEKAEQAREAKAAIEVEEERKKLLRLAEIQSGLPLIDAEVEKSKSKLEELKAETLKWETAVREGLEGRKRLIEEMEALKIQSAKPKADNIFQGKNNGATEAMKHSLEDSNLTDFTQGFDQSKAREQLNVPNQDGISDDQGRQENAPKAAPATADQMLKIAPSGPVGEDSEFTSPNDSPGAIDMSEDSAQGSSTNNRQEVETNTLSSSHSGLPEPTTIETAPPVPVLSNANATGVADAGVEGSDTSDASRVPRSDASNNAKPPPDINDKPPAAANESDQEEGEIDEGNRSFDDSDFYEPPEATTPINISPVTENLQPQETSINIHQVTPVTNGRISQDTPNGSGDILQVSTTDPVFPVKEPLSDVLHNNLTFTPYESPLKQFRGYRYHPNFQKDVPGGFRSLTYSHNINPDVSMCSFETSGGICNDSSCSFQHFRDVKMNDDLVLAQLGSVNVGRDEEEKFQYREGLKQIIQGMRTQKVKDFTTVASQIAAYPAKFLNDNSRVLILDAHQQPQQHHHQQLHQPVQ